MLLVAGVTSGVDGFACGEVEEFVEGTEFGTGEAGWAEVAEAHDADNSGGIVRVGVFGFGRSRG